MYILHRHCRLFYILRRKEMNSRMIIQNGKIFGETGQFRWGSIVIGKDKFEEIIYDVPVVAGEADIVIDASGLYVIPGMVDIHLHGCAGYDFCDGTREAFEGIAGYQVKNGVTTISPATMTLPAERLADIFKAAGEYCKKNDTVIRGITMEGPFISEKKRGAQNLRFIHTPDVQLYRRMQELCDGLIRQVAVAPEEDEELHFIKEVSRETVVSVAHTSADFSLADKAFKAGATHVTHLYNAMPAFGHRAPGVVGAAFDNKDVFVELICDGVHIHPSVVRAVFELFGAERICMISDSMMATGMPDGEYCLGEQAVTVKGRKAILADGTIAGSVSNLYDCLRMAVLEMDIPLEKAILSCTQTPAKALGMENVCGSIKKGMPADCVLLDADLNIRTIIKNGQRIYHGI